MSATSTTPTVAPRARFAGLRQIVRYNWPNYVVAAVCMALALGWLACNPDAARPRRSLAWVLVSLAGWWSFASLVASHWVYDRSCVYRWTWIPEALPGAPQNWLNLHAGLDDSTKTLSRIFPGSFGQAGDFYLEAEMGEPSTRRAREDRHDSIPAITVDPRKLPYADQSFDTVFLLFAAHELRRAGSREAFFREVVRVLAPGGTVLLVEHVRDAANFLAYGPGCLHFLPTGEWRRLATLASLKLSREFSMTPFVRVMVLRRTP